MVYPHSPLRKTSELRSEILWTPHDATDSQELSGHDSQVAGPACTDALRHLGRTETDGETMAWNGARAMNPTVHGLVLGKSESDFP